MEEIKCRRVSSENCDFNVNTSDDIILYLKHYNAIHDPSFIARCEDDLRVEYQEYIEKLKQIIERTSTPQ